MTLYGPSLASRIEQRLVLGEGGCLLWPGGLDRHGYGRVKVGGVQTGPHRALWIAKRGLIPDGLVIDHLCRVRHCVNLDHMEVVTVSVNALRGNLQWKPGRKGRKPRGLGDICGRGHELTEATTAIRRSKDGYVRMVCLPCERARTVAWKARQKAA